MADTAAARSLRAVIIDREPARFLAGLGKILAPRTKGANPDLDFFAAAELLTRIRSRKMLSQSQRSSL